ncbi:hypothetical protein UY3_07148 [Chelonia mydas]|uniref:Uncharacterized protein n=1 Tax=Chelonia mydas TaxID=8469 RepID=M7C583_CHEMY|nr:hypothetical protein UY3_07148 [Chelonia mydas]
MKGMSTLPAASAGSDRSSEGRWGGGSSQLTAVKTPPGKGSPDATPYVGAERWKTQTTCFRGALNNDLLLSNPPLKTVIETLQNSPIRHCSPLHKPENQELDEFH